MSNMHMQHIDEANFAHRLSKRTHDMPNELLAFTTLSARAQA